MNPVKKKKINKYLNSLFVEKTIKEVGLQQKIIEFFRKNPIPSNKKIESFSKNLGIEHHHFEEEVYKMFGSIISEGKSKKYRGGFDSDQLKMGISVEREHTNNKHLAEKIARDHLSEIPDYYTRLKEMEENFKKKG